MLNRHSNQIPRGIEIYVNVFVYLFSLCNSMVGKLDQCGVGI